VDGAALAPVECLTPSASLLLLLAFFYL